MDNNSTLLPPATATYRMGLLYRPTRTSWVSLARLCARVAQDPLRRVLSQQVPWARWLWDLGAHGLVQRGGYGVIDATSGERFTRGADAGSWVGSSRVGKPVGGRPVVLLLWTKGKWKVPRGMRIWQKGGPSKVEVALGLLRQARRRGLPPAYVLCESWYAAAEIRNLLESGGWHSILRLKSNRKCGEQSLRTPWPHRYGQARGKLQGIGHQVLGVKDGRRYGGTNKVRLTSRAGKAHSAHRQQIEGTFRLLKQEFGWGSWSCRKPQAQWAQLHLGLYALVFTQQ